MKKSSTTLTDHICLQVSRSHKSTYVTIEDISSFLTKLDTQSETN